MSRKGIPKQLWRFKTIEGVVHKHCTKCREYKPLELFTKAKNTLDKRTPNCSACRNKIPQDKAKKRAAYALDGKSKKALYYQKNKQRIHKQRLERIHTNDDLLVMNRLRKAIRKVRLKTGVKKSSKYEVIVGMNKTDLFAYLKTTFERVYAIPYLDIYFDDLHIDHIIPLSSGKTEEDFIKLCHHSNLQFLHEDHNMSKKTFLEYVIPPFPIENYIVKYAALCYTN